MSPQECAAAAEVAALLEKGSSLVHTDTLGAVAVYHAAATCGNPHAQFTIGALASVGLFGVPTNPLQSALHLNFASLGGDELATIAQAYRHFMGVGAPEDCDAAANFYKLAASAAVNQRKRWGAAPSVNRHRLSVEQLGGVAGLNELEGPKVALHGLVQEAERLAQQSDREDADTTGLPQQMQYVWREAMQQLNTALRSAYRTAGGWHLQDDHSQLEIVDYFRNQATARSDAQAHVALGHIHYYGLRGQAHDYNAAVDHFMAAAEATGVLEESDAAAAETDDAVSEGGQDADRDMRLMSMAMLGECYISGRGVKRDVDVALDFLTPAVRAAHPVALNAMGVLVLQGETDYGFTVSTFPEVSTVTTMTVDKKSGTVTTEESKQKLPTDLDPKNAVHRRRVGLAFLRAAAQAGHVAAMHNLGLMYMAAPSAVPSGLHPPLERPKGGKGGSEQPSLGDRKPSSHVWTRSFDKARQNFGLAAQQGYLPSLHAMGNMHINGVGGPPNCKAGTRMLRTVVHRGPAALLLDTAHARLAAADINAARFEMLSLVPASPATHADVQISQNDDSPLLGAGDWDHEDYHGKGIEALRGALLQYLRAAAMGFEIAQWNAATILQRFGEQAFQPSGTKVDHSEEAYVTLLQLAAKQGNVEAHIALGDILHRGSPSATPAPAAAATHYRTAADMGSGRALYNLGTMHEHGDGLPVDFPLAKRYYDMALAADSSAWVPVNLSLFMLKLKTAVSEWMQNNYSQCLAMHKKVPYFDDAAELLGFTAAVKCRKSTASKQAGTHQERATRDTKAKQGGHTDESESGSGADTPSRRSSRMSAAIEAANNRKRRQRAQVGVLGRVRNYVLQAVTEARQTIRIAMRDGWSSLEKEDRMILQLLAATVLLYILRRLRGA